MFLFPGASAPLRTLQPFQVGNILRPSDRALISNQVGNGKDRNALSCETGDDPRRPRLIELDGIDAGKDVDPKRRETNLEDDPGAAEVLFGQILHRRPEHCQCP